MVAPKFNEAILELATALAVVELGVCIWDAMTEESRSVYLNKADLLLTALRDRGWRVNRA